MKLFEHPDFGQAILQAAEHFRDQGWRPAIIEKDYYVKEALRIIAAAGDKVILKGGTSLAKGWNLIQRFSEDIDIFLDPAAFQPALGKRGIDRELKRLRDAVGAHPALALLQNEGQTIGGFGAYARHYYDLFQLAAQAEVIIMLKSSEYAAIRADYDRISRTHFPKSYFYPDGMRFSRSDALFPPAALAAVIGAEYEMQCRMLCYGPYPSWMEVQARLLELRDLL